MRQVTTFVAKLQRSAEKLWSGAYLAPFQQQSLGLEVAGYPSAMDDRCEGSNDSRSSLSDIMEGVWNMAVPKSKISKSKKRMKYQRYMAKQINWMRCDRCGDPKLPHRICEENKDICVLSDEEYAAFLAKQEDLSLSETRT